MPADRAVRLLVSGLAVALVILSRPPVQAAGTVPERLDAAQALHVLNRLGYGPRPGDVARLQHEGFEAYL